MHPDPKYKDRLLQGRGPRAAGEAGCGPQEADCCRPEAAGVGPEQGQDCVLLKGGGGSGLSRVQEPPNRRGRPRSLPGLGLGPLETQRTLHFTMQGQRLPQSQGDPEPRQQGWGGGFKDKGMGALGHRRAVCKWGRTIAPPLQGWFPGCESVALEPGVGPPVGLEWGCSPGQGEGKKLRGKRPSSSPLPCPTTPDTALCSATCCLSERVGTRPSLHPGWGLGASSPAAGKSGAAQRPAAHPPLPQGMTGAGQAQQG